MSGDLLRFMFCDLFAFKKLGDVFANDGADVPGFDEYCWNELNNLVSKRSENTHTLFPN